MSAVMQPSVSLSGEVGPLAPANAQYRPVPQPAKATTPLVIVGERPSLTPKKQNSRNVNHRGIPILYL